MSSIENNFFKRNTFFKNAIALIKTNIFINTVSFNNVFGGQLTSTLPGVRFITCINGHRYCFIIFESGSIVITNLFYINEMESIYNYFINLLTLTLYLNMSHFHKFSKNNTIRHWFTDTNNLEDDRILFPYKNRQCAEKGVSETLTLSFMIENFQFSFQINQIAFKQMYRIIDRNGIGLMDISTICNQNETTRQHLYSFIQTKLVEHGYDCEYAEILPKDEFPADLLKIHIKRTVKSIDLIRYKSQAARRRKQGSFETQIVSIHLFKNGKIITTGAQTREDIMLFMHIFNLILDYFFSQ